MLIPLSTTPPYFPRKKPLASCAHMVPWLGSCRAGGNGTHHGPCPVSKNLVLRRAQGSSPQGAAGLLFFFNLLPHRPAGKH